MKTLATLLLTAAALAPLRSSGAEEPAAPATPEAAAPAPAPDAAPPEASAPVPGTAPAPEAAATPAAPASTPEPPAAPPPRSIFYEGPHFGLQLDAGAPAGFGLQVMVRPWKFLRVGIGPAHNVLGLGVKGSLTLIPFHWYVTPTLGLEAGRYAPADATRFIQDADPSANALLSSIGYSYYSADLGIEFGSENRFVFFLRAGLSELRPTVGDVNAALKASDPTLRVRAAQPTLKARIPAVRLGFLVYVF